MSVQWQLPAERWRESRVLLGRVAPRRNLSINSRRKSRSKRNTEMETERREEKKNNNLLICASRFENTERNCVRRFSLSLNLHFLTSKLWAIRSFTAMWFSGSTVFDQQRRNASRTRLFIWHLSFTNKNTAELNAIATSMVCEECLVCGTALDVVRGNNWNHFSFSCARLCVRRAANV